MTGKQKIQRWASVGYWHVEKSDDGEYVTFEDHEAVVSSMQHEIDKLNVEQSIANSETTKLEGDLFSCQESLSHLQQSLQAASSESRFSLVSRWLWGLTGLSPRQW
jgi:predicted nuclease with TOPRIM domain